MNYETCKEVTENSKSEFVTFSETSPSDKFNTKFCQLKYKLDNFSVCKKNILFTMNSSYKFIVLALLVVELTVAEPSRLGASVGGMSNGANGGGHFGNSASMLSTYSILRHTLTNQRINQQIASNSASSSSSGNSGNWANPNVDNVVHGIPLPPAPKSYDTSQSNSNSDETSQQTDLEYYDEPDNDDVKTSFKYGDDDNVY